MPMPIWKMTHPVINPITFEVVASRVAVAIFRASSTKSRPS